MKAIRVKIQTYCQPKITGSLRWLSDISADLELLANEYSVAIKPRGKMSGCDCDNRIAGRMLEVDDEGTIAVRKLERCNFPYTGGLDLNLTTEAQEYAAKLKAAAEKFLDAWVETTCWGIEEEFNDEIQLILAPEDPA